MTDKTKEKKETKELIKSLSEMMSQFNRDSFDIMKELAQMGIFIIENHLLDHYQQWCKKANIEKRLASLLKNSLK